MRTPAASDVEIDPSNPDVLYASCGNPAKGRGKIRTFNGTNGGFSNRPTVARRGIQLTDGLPADLAQINVAIAPSNPRRLYATVGPRPKLGIYRSDDAGENWSQITADPRPGRIGGGDLPVPKVDPKNPNIVYCASTVTCFLMTAARPGQVFRGAPGGDDYQNLWINPNDPNTILLVSDQGAIVTVNGGATWSSWYNQPTAQLYHVIADNPFPYEFAPGSRRVVRCVSRPRQ